MWGTSGGFPTCRERDVGHIEGIPTCRERDVGYIEGVVSLQAEHIMRTKMVMSTKMAALKL